MLDDRSTSPETTAWSTNYYYTLNYYSTNELSNYANVLHFYEFVCHTVEYEAQRV